MVEIAIHKKIYLLSTYIPKCILQQGQKSQEFRPVFEKVK